LAKIVQLPDDLSNKIAAGEVVERPASVVKELVENAIDANSSVIEIDVEEAGLASIKVLDDGEGMDAEDCRTAFLRHATSKIKDENDLFRVRTLGFRGEALPSIASVSHLSIKTSTGEGAGTHLTLQGEESFPSKKRQAAEEPKLRLPTCFSIRRQG
jgi:DNA mismatch repair protein MutL